MSNNEIQSVDFFYPYQNYSNGGFIGIEVDLDQLFVKNLVVVQAVNLESADREMLGFETITFAPFDNTMIDASLLTHLEIEWINSYHASMRQTLGPLLPPEVASWLEKATMKIQ